MSLNRYDARRDANENDLVAAAEQLGAEWVQDGPLDGWIGWRQRWFPCEIKTAKGKYTEAQVKFLTRCRLRGLPVFTWRTLEDVTASLGAKVSA